MCVSFLNRTSVWYLAWCRSCATLLAIKWEAVQRFTVGWESNAKRLIWCPRNRALRRTGSAGIEWATYFDFCTVNRHFHHIQSVVPATFIIRETNVTRQSFYFHLKIKQKTTLFSILNHTTCNMNIYDYSLWCFSATKTEIRDAKNVCGNFSPTRKSVIRVPAFVLFLQLSYSHHNWCSICAQKLSIAYVS